jgi:YkoY family integral membrane protein
MEAILLEYLWVLLVLVALEGLLAADNAVVMAVMVKHLPKKQQKKALFYGLAGAFIFRFAALFMIAWLVDVWQIQALGAAYLIFIATKHIYDQRKGKEHSLEPEVLKGSGFWMTVLKVELADIAFAVDSMLAAVALAITLPHLGNVEVGGINGGQFGVMLAGGIVGIIIMRFAAHKLVKLLENYPQLETTAFVIVGWVGVKLTVLTMSHESLGILPHEFAHSTPWKITFWGVLLLIVLVGAWVSVRKKKEVEAAHKIHS